MIDTADHIHRQLAEVELPGAATQRELERTLRRYADEANRLLLARELGPHALRPLPLPPFRR